MHWRDDDRVWDCRRQPLRLADPTTTSVGSKRDMRFTQLNARSSAISAQYIFEVSLAAKPLVSLTMALTALAITRTSFNSVQN